MKKQNKYDFNKLYEAILTLQTKEECSAFFNDICTIQEVESLAQRIDVAMRLKKGENYIDINKNTGASTATISRVSRYLNYGAGGYDIVIQRLENK